MMSTVLAVIRDGKIELMEHADLPEGTRVLVTLLPGEDRTLWMGVSRSAVDVVWDNAEDDVYAELLKV